MSSLYPYVHNLFTYENSRENSMKESELLNLPDLHFFLWCQKKYKVNKGVFNTIDSWFYDYGIVPILYRRIHILAFLDFAKNAEAESTTDSALQKYLRFGPGGLARKLSEFITQTESGEFTI